MILKKKQEYTNNAFHIFNVEKHLLGSNGYKKNIQ